jgi:class 3 adenylate cyclase
MAELSSRRRRQLPDRAFAYIDSRGRRRLPINDESHVRNALARFGQLVFDDEPARARARKRLLLAAKRYGIVPIGFIDGQLKEHGSSRLPSGSVTFLMTDVVDSTGLLNQLGDGYASLLSDIRRLMRKAVRHSGGFEVDARGDEYFAVFKHRNGAVAAGIQIQREIAGRAWTDGAAVRIRAAIHSGRPTLTDAGYVGIAVHAVRRICSIAEAGQLLASRGVAMSLMRDTASTWQFAELGLYRLKGIPEQELLYLVS